MPRYSSLLVPVSSGQIDGTDSLNCTVRALANCTDMPVTQAKSILAKHGRKDHAGAYLETMIAAYAEAGLSFLGYFGKSKRVYTEKYHASANRYCSDHHSGITLAKFCSVYNRGSYIVSVKGHAVCVRGGKVIDTAPNSGNKIVLAAWKKVL